MKELYFPEEVIDAYDNLGRPKSVCAIEKGLINKTFLVSTDKGNYILQELSPIFPEDIHYDSEAVCRKLAQADILAPTILRNRFGDLFYRHDGRVFRALIYIPSESFHAISSSSMAYEAGRVLGQFHYALKDFSYTYRSTRRHKGDYPFHVENLKNALDMHRAHDFYEQANSFAEKMMGHMQGFLNLRSTPRHAHGDPKISNILFAEGKGICLIDFDTLGSSGWSLEMADALRSWANPKAEDILDANVDLAISEEALKGYAMIMHGQWLDIEKEELISHTQAVSLCLAIRYLTDVLNENYFAFDKTRFARAAEHHWLRAEAMYNLFLDFARKKHLLKDMVESLL